MQRKNNCEKKLHNTHGYNFNNAATTTAQLMTTYNNSKRNAIITDNKKKIAKSNQHQADKQQTFKWQATATHNANVARNLSEAE